MTERRLLPALIAIALVVSSVAAVGVVAAEESADGDVRVTQQDDGGLLVEFDNETFPDRQSVSVAVTANNETTELETSAANVGDPNWWGREVAPDALPDASLADARVTVSYNGTEEFNQTMDLRYLEVDTESVKFDSQGRLAMNVTSVGLGDGAVGVEAEALGGESVTMEGSIDENGVLRFERSQFESLLLPPRNVTLSAADSGIQFVADDRIDLGEEAESDVRLQHDGVLVSSPLLVDGQQYHVTLTTDDPPGTYVGTEDASGRQIKLQNEYVTGTGDVRITLDGETVVESSFEPEETLSGSVENGTVTITEGTLPSGSVERAVLNDSSGVRLLENVSQQSGAVTLPGSYTGGVETLVLLYEGGSTAFVDVGGEQSGPAPGEATPTETPSQGTGLPIPIDSTNFLIGGGLALLLTGLLVLGLFWKTSPSKGRTTGGTSGPRQLTVSVVDGLSNSRINEPVTVEVTPKEERTKEGYSVDTTSRSHEVRGGRGDIEVPRERIELEATHNGISTSREVNLAHSDQVTLTLGPVTRTVTIRDEHGEPIPGATVSIQSDGQTHLTRETDEHGQAKFEVSVGAREFDIVVDRDRFESASRHVADPGAFPDAISLVEKTGTLRVRTTVDGEPTDAVDLRIRAGEDTPPEAAPSVEEPDEPGIYQFDDVQIGTYELLATVDAPKFESDRQTVQIDADDAVTVELDAAFQFSIANHRDDVAALRTAADGLVPSSQIDTAIHAYYASVAHSLADVVESLPERGDQFAATGVDPDAVAEALLDAGLDVVGVVEDALNTKQNVDLFNACADLPSATVEWDEFEVGELFDLAQQQRLDQTTAIRERIEQLEDRIEAERDELNVVSPASDVLDELRDYARRTQESDAARNAAVAFVVVGFADAVEALFERRQLRKRLQHTRF